jgi:hypothetical protein
LAVITLICLLGLAVSVLGLVAALLFLRRLGLPSVQRQGPVTLILPLTGPAPGLEGLVQTLATQSLQPRRLLISVESVHDPAWSRAKDQEGRHDLPIEVVLAGEATRCAQKCTNQLAALRRIDPLDQAVVLLDADILPPPWWLSALVTPILDHSADVVTGYRWQVPSGARLGAHLGAAVDRTIALLPRLASFRTTWGGSLALSPRALAALAPEELLGTTLSDDCAIGERAAALGLRVLTRRALLVPTPQGGDVGSVWRFGRRQYQIIHTYRPILWWLAFATLTLRLGTWGLLLAHSGSTPSRVGLTAMIGLSLGGFLVQLQVAHRLGFQDPPGVRRWQFALVLAKPLVDLFHWTMVASAVGARTLRWGHVTYRVVGPKTIAIKSRIPWV